MRMFDRRKVIGLVVLICIALAAGSWLGRNSGQAQSKSPLSAMALQPQDLSQNALWNEAGGLSVDDMSHPLSSGNLTANRWQNADTLLKYEDVYKVEAVELDDNGSGAAVVGNYLYRYPDQAQAQAAGKAFVDEIQRTHGALLNNEAEQDQFTGQEMKIAGSEGTDIYWYAGVDERTLYLLMVEGSPSPLTQKLFDGLVEHLRSRP